MSALTVIPITLKKYKKLVEYGEIDETAVYIIIDYEELKDD